MLASDGYGYSGGYKTGLPITGIEQAEKITGVIVAHAGTIFDGILRNSGGRVLCVTAVGNTQQQAIDRTYEAIDYISLEGSIYRTDIKVL